jgi:hypothetical protein
MGHLPRTFKGDSSGRSVAKNAFQVRRQLQEGVEVTPVHGTL